MESALPGLRHRLHYPKTRTRILRLSLCLLLAAATVLLGALSVRRKVASFQPLGFVAERAGGVVRVDRVDSPASGVLAGDEILLVDGGEVGGADALAQRLRERPASELAVLRAGQVRRVAYHRPPLSPDVPYLILVFIGAAYLLIGLYTLTRQPSREGFVFCLWCLTSALLYLLTPVPPVDAEYRLAYFGDQLARSFLPALTLHLFLIFPALPLPAAPGSSRRPGLLHEPSRLLIALLYLPGAVLLTLQLDLMLSNGRWLFGGHPTAAALQALDRLDLLHLVAFSLAAVAVLVYRVLRERGWEPRRQMHWMIFGLAGGYLPFLGFYVVPFVLGLRPPELLTAVAVLPLALVPLTFAYAILRYKLWDIEVIARDIISATLTLLLGVFGFSLVNLAITRGISRATCSRSPPAWASPACWCRRATRSPRRSSAYSTAAPSASAAPCWDSAATCSTSATSAASAAPCSTAWRPAWTSSGPASTWPKATTSSFSTRSVRPARPALPPERAIRHARPGAPTHSPPTAAWSPPPPAPRIAGRWALRRRCCRPRRSTRRSGARTPTGSAAPSCRPARRRRCSSCSSPATATPSR